MSAADMSRSLVIGGVGGAASHPLRQTSHSRFGAFAPCHRVVLKGSMGKAADTPLQLRSPPGGGSLRLRGASGMLYRYAQCQRASRIGVAVNPDA
jgi:hypothetical protein